MTKPNALEGTSAEADTFRILISTDNHLGYLENDTERGEDSFNTFEEILKLAESNNVDFILLGGDLFHENKPSPAVVNKCIVLLRKHCMGSKPVSIEYLSDQAENFNHCEHSLVNYEDPNLNISIPIFSIHGNHDDPSGAKQTSAVDILSACGLVNYFGKSSKLTEVKISPILLQKGTSKLALYGLSYIKDERLSRLFRDGLVQMFRPCEDTDQWFNIFVTHQNRSDHGVNKYLPEEALPNFLNLVIWGHEHACRIEPEYNATQNFSVIQPGSSVITSLCEGESLPKYVGLLKIKGKDSSLKKLPLLTSRPFIFDNIVLSQCTIPDTDEKPSNNVECYLEEKIEHYIRESQLKLTGHVKQPKLPLIRLRVEYNDEAQTFNVIRFGQQYHGKVANPLDMILLRKHKNLGSRNKSEFDVDKENLNELLENEADDIWEVKMNSIMEKYFSEKAAHQLKLLPIKMMSEMTTRFMYKQEKNAVKDAVVRITTSAEKYLSTKNADPDRIEDALNEFQPSSQNLQTVSTNGDNLNIENIEHHVSDNDDDFAISSAVNVNEDKAAMGRGRARGRARGTTSRNGRGRAACNSKAKATQSKLNVTTQSPAKRSSYSRVFYNSDSE